MNTRVLIVTSIVLMLLALAPGLAMADGVTGVAVSPLTASPDEIITVKGEVLGPNSEVEVRISGPGGVDVDLGEVTADEEGDFTTEFRLPPDLQPGTYQLTATGEESATTVVSVEGGPEGGAGSEPGAMEQPEPVIETRPLGESIGLVALFGVLASLGLFLARMSHQKA